MAKGVKYSSIKVKSTNGAGKLPVQGCLRFQVVNKGDDTVYVADNDEIESGASQCYGEVGDRVYCDDVDIRFLTRSATEYIILRRWFPGDDCCPPTS